MPWLVWVGLIKLEGSGKREPGLRNCLHQISLWAYQWDIFFTHDWWGRAQSTVGGVTPTKVTLGRLRNQVEQAGTAIQEAALCQGPCLHLLSPCPDFPQGLTLLLVMVHIIAIERQREQPPGKSSRKNPPRVPNTGCLVLHALCALVVRAPEAHVSVPETPRRKRMVIEWWW